MTDEERVQGIIRCFTGIAFAEDHAALEAILRDALRYRWLRDRMTHQHRGNAIGWTLDDLLPGDDPDAAIDAELDCYLRQAARGKG